MNKWQPTNYKTIFILVWLAWPYDASASQTTDIEKMFMDIGKIIRRDAEGKNLAIQKWIFYEIEYRGNGPETQTLTDR